MNSEAVLYETLKDNIQNIIEKIQLILELKKYRTTILLLSISLHLKQPNREIEKAIRKNVKRQVLNLMANRSKLLNNGFYLSRLSTK
ncbi:MAG: hypothetical protein R2777_10480 [Chitinophagales bacterium]